MNVIEQKPQFGVTYDAGYDAFLARKEDFLAAGIRWFERWDKIPGTPPVSHAIKIVGEDQTIEAFADGVHYGKLSDYIKDENIAVIVRKPAGWTPDMAARMVDAAKSHIGEKYNYMLIAAMAVTNTYFGKWVDSWLKGKFSNWLEKSADTKTREICSSLVARVDDAMPELHGKGVLALPPYDIMPIMLCGDETIYEPGAVELVP